MPGTWSIDSTCGVTPDYVTTIIRTRVMTVVGNVGISCPSPLPSPPPSSCDTWKDALSKHSALGCLPVEEVTP